MQNPILTPKEVKEEGRFFQGVGAVTAKVNHSNKKTHNKNIFNTSNRI